MKKNHFIALVVILIIQQNIQAYNYLNVRDPQNWLVSPGKIDETLEENVISVSFDGGTIRKKFSVDNFYLSKN